MAQKSDQNAPRPTDAPPAPDAADAPGSPEEEHHLERQRRENRDAIGALGVEPYGGRIDGLIPLDRARANYNEAADAEHKTRAGDEGARDPRPVVRVAGRVMLLRDNGKLLWINLRDHTGDLQIAVSKRDCDETGFQTAKLADLGDILAAEGPLTKSKTGEVTIWATKLEIACKSLAPPPEKWKGLNDPDLRYRKRYVDLYANPETMRVFRTRSVLISRMRRFFDERDFIEVETPMLQTLAGGAAARPFVTHMNAMDMQLFLRIAPELYLKRLLVGGMSRVYEINRNFRNEGLSRRHNPEFTMLELYQAFADYNVMMEHTEGLIRELAVFVASERAGAAVDGIDPAAVRLPWEGGEIDYGSPFERVRYEDLFEKALGFPMTDRGRCIADAKKRGLKTEGMDHWLIVNELFEEVAEQTIDPARPTFVIDYPAALCPLTRQKKGNPEIAERFELYIAGMELANAYTELNDPDVQEAKFREQLKGVDDEESAFRTFDADFIEALKVGMPPAGGLGIGVDRLMMLLLDQRSIRDVLLFPFMRPL